MSRTSKSDAVPQAVQSCHELLAWLIPLLDTFPRVRRSRVRLLGPWGDENFSVA